MATLEEGFEFTGSLGRYSAYRMKGSDKIVIRKKGGPSKKKIKTSPRFERLRENMEEFKGVGKASRAVIWSVAPVKHLASPRLSGDLSSVFKKIQDLDPQSGRGERNIYLSQHRFMLAGFQLNKKHPFQAVVTGPLGCTFHRETKSAVVQLPGLVKGINLLLPWKHPVYRFSISLAVISDLILEKGNYNDYGHEWDRTDLYTEWQVANEPFQPQTYELKLKDPGAIKDTQSLVLSIGIEMGTISAYGDIGFVKGAGAACILAVG
ncbi:hypothetical protein [uncultured Chitinophaga sp.]|jgi:hypothetical protein|uniref:hypothetical protein n=1 Tax=uncultured Chitinophaga sp. TaxID=339340 RepID=UPI002604DF24|nr:hypothetical protein [uncultured Chitinophaga sp.]